MPVLRVPLVGSFNQRGLSGTAALQVLEDQRFLNCAFNLVTNSVTGKSTIYVEKRPGWGQDSQVSTGIASTGLIKPQLFNSPLSAFGETNSAVYVGTINVGNITGRALHFTETVIGTTSNVLIKSSDGTGWYYTAGAKDTLTYTGHTSSGGFLVSTIADVTGLYSGQLITGNTIAAGSRVTSVSAATSTIGLSVTTSANSTGAIITKEPIAKILSANFLATGTRISAFKVMDGFHFYATDDGFLNNSDLNTITAYTATSRLAMQQSPDAAIGLAVQKNYIVGFGLNSKEVFQNAGLAAGSPLLPVPQLAERIGCLDQRSIAQMEDEIFFVSSPSEGDLGVYQMSKGLAAQRISTPQIDRIIGTASGSGAIYASAFRLGGYPYAAFSVSIAQDGPSSMLLLETGDNLLLESGDKLLLEDSPAQLASFVRLLVYNVTLKLWSEWDSSLATFITSIGSGTDNKLLATSRFNTGGKIYRVDPVADGQLYQDDGAAFSLEIRTSGIDFGDNKIKFVRSIVLIADQQTSGTATLEFSDDDYASWTTLGTFDLTVPRPQITRCGSHVGKRAYRLTHSANTAFRAQALEFNYSMGTS